MNQFFNFNRFSLLVAKHWADNKKRYLLSLAAFIGLLITWFVFTMLVDSRDPMDNELQQVTFFFTLFAVGTFYASQYFRDLGSRSKGINFLLVPASAFEKTLCSILFTFALFFIVFVAGFYLVDFLMVTIADHISTNNERTVINVFETASSIFENNSMLNLMLIFFGIQSVFLLGSVYFEKYSFIKTVIGGFIVFFTMFLLVYLFYDRLMPRGEYTDAMLNAYRVDMGGQEDRLIRIPSWMGQLLYYILLYAMAPFVWIVTYYRLKEKQV